MPSATTTTPEPAAAPAVARVSLGGVKKKEAAAKPAKQYPTLPDTEDGTVSMLAERIRRESEEFESLKGSLEISKAELKSLGVPFYFSHNAGKEEIPSSLRCEIRRDGQVTGAVLLSMTNKYPGADEPAIAEIIGAEETARYFRQSFMFAIDGDKIPATAAGDLITELQGLFEKHNCSEALTAEEKIVPIESFHTARHKVFTPEQNAALHLVLPCQASVKVKNVK